MEQPLKKQLIFTFIGIVILLAAFLTLLFLFSRRGGLSSSFLSTGETYPCPKDFCGNWVLGSCIGSKERYKERECYDYSENALNSLECEAKKKIFYEKGSQQDETC